MSTWQDAHIGGESPQVALRVTPDEKKRLEQLRRDLRLTSKSQVIRAALDLLERVAVTGVVLGLGERGVDWREEIGLMHKGADKLRERYGVTAGSGASSSGSPADDAPTGQLDLPEMPEPIPQHGERLGGHT